MQNTDPYTLFLVHVLCFSRYVKLAKTEISRQSGGAGQPQAMSRVRRYVVLAEEEAQLLRTPVPFATFGPVEAEVLEIVCGHVLPRAAAGSSQ